MVDQYVTIFSTLQSRSKDQAKQVYRKKAKQNILTADFSNYFQWRIQKQLPTPRNANINKIAMRQVYIDRVCAKGKKRSEVRVKNLLLTTGSQPASLHEVFSVGKADIRIAVWSEVLTL